MAPDALAEEARQLAKYLTYYAEYKQWPRLREGADFVRALDSERERLLGQVVELREAAIEFFGGGEEALITFANLPDENLPAAARRRKRLARAVLSAAGTEAEPKQKWTDGDEIQAAVAGGMFGSMPEEGGTPPVGSVPAGKSDRGEGET